MLGRALVPSRHLSATHQSTAAQHMMEDYGPNHLDLDLVVREGVIDDYFSMSNATAAKQLDEVWIRAPLWKPAPLDDIRAYFGEKVALYFAWVRTYTESLAVISAISIVFGIVQLALGVDNSGVGVYGAIIAIWSTCFTEFWKRRQSVLAYLWNVENFEENEPPRPEYIAKYQLMAPSRRQRLFEESFGVWTGRGFVKVPGQTASRVDKQTVLKVREYVRRVALGALTTVLFVLSAVVGMTGLGAVPCERAFAHNVAPTTWRGAGVQAPWASWWQRSWRRETSRGRVALTLEVRRVAAAPVRGQSCWLTGRPCGASPALANAVFINVMNIVWSIVAVRLNDWVRSEPRAVAPACHAPHPELPRPVRRKPIALTRGTRTPSSSRRLRSRYAQRTEWRGPQGKSFRPCPLLPSPRASA